MRVLLAGSLDVGSPDYGAVRANVEALVSELAQRRAEFVLRNSVFDTPGVMPIDIVVREALAAEHAASGATPRVMVFNEPGLPVDVPLPFAHKTCAATTRRRVEFYRELLTLCDIVVGVGGRAGLMRLSVASEFRGKPMLFLPGSGGVADAYWLEFVSRSTLLRFAGERVLLQLRQIPYASQAPDPSYGKEILKRIRLLIRSAKRHLLAEMISPNNVTAITVVHALRRFSVGMWVLVGSLASGLFALGLSVGRVMCGAR